MAIMKLINIKEVLPIFMPLAQISTFEDFTRICIFPFILCCPAKNNQNNNLECDSFDSEIASIDC